MFISYSFPSIINNVHLLGIPKEIMDESVKASKKLEELTNEKIIRVKAKKLYQQLKQQQ